MKGYSVESTRCSRDAGYDFRISPFKGDSAIVEVKKYKKSSQVPASVIRQIVGAMVLERVPIGIVVSSAPFTQAATFFASEIEQTIFLWTIEDLKKMNEISRILIEAKSNHPIF